LSHSHLRRSTAPADILAACARSSSRIGTDSVDKEKLRSPVRDSVNKIDHCAVAAVEESGELSKIRRGHVVVHGVEVSVVGDVQRIEAEPNVMNFAGTRA